MSKFDLPKNIGIRTIGLLMMTFIPGMAIGAVATQSWFIGGLIAFGTSLATVVVALGVVIAWFGKMTGKDVEKAFRAAAAKAAEGNDELKTFVEDAQKPADSN